MISWWKTSVAVALAGALSGAGTMAAVPSSAATALPKITTVESVSCPNSSDCFAGGATAKGDVVLSTTDGGLAWSERSEGIGLGVLDCPSTKVCVGGGLGDKVLATTDGGSAWSEHTVSSSIAEVEAVSCPTATECWAAALEKDSIAVAIYRSGDAGATWSKVRAPSLTVPMSSLSGISCVNADDCLVTGYGVLVTSDGGSRWRSIALKSLVFDAVTCVTSNDCVVLSNVTSAIPSHESGAIYTTTDGGSHWTHRLTGHHVTGLESVSCATASRCVSVGSGYTPHGHEVTPWGAIEATSDGGTAWTQEQEASADYLSGVSCAAASLDCIAVGTGKSSGLILRSTDGGRSWKGVALP